MRRAVRRCGSAEKSKRFKNKNGRKGEKIMVKITLKIEGMACGMCEAHVNDALRRAFDLKKVRSSHKKGITEMICEDQPDRAAIDAALQDSGYRVTGVSCEPYVKKGLFRRR